MRMLPKIMHIVDLKENIRSHLSFQFNSQIINYYFFPKNIKHDINTNVYFYKNYDKCLRFIRNNKIYAIIVSNDIFSKKYYPEIRKRKIKLYRIYHGLPIQSYLHKNARQYIKHYRYYNAIFCPISMKLIFDKYGKNNYIGINGLTQFDYIRNVDLTKKREQFCQKNGYDKNWQYILFATNNKDNHIKEHISILNVLIEFVKGKNIKIILKIKQNSQLSKMLIQNPKHHYHKYYSKNCVHCINNETMIINYLFADFIVAQSGGTSYFDALICNRPTILVSFLSNENFFHIQTHPHLLYSRNTTELSRDLVRIGEAYCLGQEYQSEKEKILTQHFGKLENVTNYIVSVILKG